MHYLVTGGCGFIGSHLVERLLAGGHAVTVIDDLSNGKHENIPAQAKLLAQDITTPGIFDDVVLQIDGCFHLAAIVSVQKSAEEWLRTHQVNIGGMVALLDALVRNKRKIPVVFTSSAAVYGDCGDVPLKETSRLAPISAYGADKLACELHAAIAASVHGIPTIGLRLFNVYGPRQDPSSSYSGVISIFADRMKQRLPVTIYGDGEQSRDFIYVGDVVGALAASMQKLESNRLTHGIFNVCTGTQTSVSRLAHIIDTIIDMRADITHVSRRSEDTEPGKIRVSFIKKWLGLGRRKIRHAAARRGDIRISQGDPTLARQQLNFHAMMPLEDGLKKTLEI